MREQLMKRAESRGQGQGGFTLIELLVVIAILAILAGVVVFAVGNLTTEASDSACDIELRTIETAAAAAATTGVTPAPASVADLVAAGYLQDANTLGTYTVSGATVGVTSCPTTP